MNGSDENLPGQWIGQRGVVEFPPRSPNLTPLLPMEYLKGCGLP